MFKRILYYISMIFLIFLASCSINNTISDERIEPIVAYDITFCCTINYSFNDKLLTYDDNSRFGNYLYEEYDEVEIKIFDDYFNSIKCNKPICLNYDITSDGFIIKKNNDKYCVFYDDKSGNNIVYFDENYYLCESDQFLRCLNDEKCLGILLYDFKKPWNNDNMTFLYDRHYKSGKTDECYVEYEAYNLSNIGEKVSEKDIIEKAIEFVKPYSLYDEHKVYTDNKAKMYMVVLSHANSLDGEVILFYTFDGHLIGADYSWCTYSITPG